MTRGIPRGAKGREGAVCPSDRPGPMFLPGAGTGTGTGINFFTGIKVPGIEVNQMMALQ